MPGYYNFGSLLPSLESIIGGIIIGAIIYLALHIFVIILIIRAICKYQAKKNAEAFNYDYLAERTADEVFKRIQICKALEKEDTDKAVDQV